MTLRFGSLILGQCLGFAKVSFCFFLPLLQNLVIYISAMEGCGKLEFLIFDNFPLLCNSLWF